MGALELRTFFMSLPHRLSISPFSFHVVHRKRSSFQKHRFRQITNCFLKVYVLVTALDHLSKIMISSFLVRIYNASSKTMHNSKHLDLRQILKHHYLNHLCFFLRKTKNKKVAILGFEFSSKISDQILHPEGLHLSQPFRCQRRLAQLIFIMFIT